MTRPCGARSTRPARYEHVIWIWMENHTAGQVLDNADAPYETTLVHQCGTVQRYASVGSPSLPNYIGATSGDTQGIHDDAPPPDHALGVDNLFRQVRLTGRGAKSYEESMPANCTRASGGRYAVKHNPAAYFAGGDDRAACRADDVPLGTFDAGALRHDLDSNTLPAFAFITPDLCDDTHDCSVPTGDHWLGRWLPLMLASTSYRSGATAIFVVWDEPTPMPFIVVSPTTTPGTVAAVSIDHYALLRTTQEMLGLQPLLGRAARATSIRTPLNL